MSQNQGLSLTKWKLMSLDQIILDNDFIIIGWQFGIWISIFKKFHVY